MRTWWHRLQRVRAGDDGLGLAEVLVAMLLFAVVSTGLAYSMLSVLHLSRDSRVRAIAANLAAEEIDLARDTPDIFGLLDETRDVPVGSDVFHVQRRTQWVADPDGDFTCGSSAAGATLKYKRINVTVTWQGMKAGADPVRSDTVLNPDNHINDPSKGTLLVSVLRADGTGNEGVTVTASPSIGSVIDSTDAQGCTYVLRVTPGTYTVTVARSNHVSQDQVAAPSQTAVVAANATASLGFQLDQAATYTARLAPHAPPATVKVPNNNTLKVTFLSTYGRATPTPTGAPNSLAPVHRLHPFTSGYQAYAGECAAADPTAWPEVTVAGVAQRGVLADPVAAPPGGSASVDVPMAVVEVSGSTSNRFLRAVSVNPPSGSGLPGCASTVSLTYGEILPTSPTARVAIALPYGSWQLYYGNATNASTALPQARVTVPIPNAPGTVTTSNPSSVVVTADPRQPVTP